MSRKRKLRIDPTVGLESFDQCRAALAVCLSEVEREGREWHLDWLVDHLFWQFKKRMMEDPDCLQATLEICRLFRSASGPGRVTAERRFLESLAALGWDCCRRLEPLGDGECFDLVNLDRWDAAVQPLGRTMQELCAFAEETLDYKARPRDSFAGERRRLAREILEVMGKNIEAREAV